MKTMNTLEKMEFAELVLEIISKKHSLLIDQITQPASPELPDAVTVFAYGENTRVPKGSRFGLLSGLRFIVDNIRKERGEPSREETANAAGLEDISHAKSPAIELGPDACCACGSKEPLEVMVHAVRLYDWKTGGPQSRWMLAPASEPGQIGTCRDCGKSYRLPA